MPKRKLPPLLPNKVPRQARSQRTYDDIVEAGARLLLKSGYEALTTNHVAEEAGVGIASVYEYFPNKQAIVAAVVTHVVSEMVGEFRESLAEAMGSEPQEALRMWLRTMFRAVERRKAIITVFVREVPFLLEIPAVESLSARLLELAQSAAVLARKPLIVEHAAAVSYLMTVMVQAAVLGSVIRRPAHLGQEELRETLTKLLIELLA
ncbi:TetR/AcrR family transcriptional regulator [Pendulispora albinea]|uniref:TetR/AcrR family transcriptional regulator n=1 Tax=Pendulispora albinea TaxID=2741071 RepID=A0ABZ2LWJ4_9BACT